MAYDERLAEKVRLAFGKKRGITEKKMFGGLCFLLHGNMICGVESERLMIRVGPEKYQSCLKRKHARPMDFTGKPMTGFIYVGPPALKRKDSLVKWIGLGLDYAKSLPKK